TNVLVAESELATFSRLRSHWRSSARLESSLFTEESRSRAIQSQYAEAALTPVPVLRELDRVRTDGVRGSRRFTCTPVIGDRKVKIHLDIETRRPSSVLALPSWSEEEILEEMEAPEQVKGHQLQRANSRGSLRKLPSPQEKTLALAHLLGGEVVTLDVTGKSFDRMTAFRRSLVHYEFMKERRRKRGPRRNTVAGDNPSLIRNAFHLFSQRGAKMHKIGVGEPLEMSYEDTTTQTDTDVVSQSSSETKNVLRSQNGILCHSHIPNRTFMAEVHSAPQNLNAKMLKDDAMEPEGRSSSGHWSASASSGGSTRTSLESENHKVPSGDDHDSALSDGSSSRPNDNSLSERTVSPDDVPFIDEESSSLYSCDTEGYYTSFHTDSGLRALQREVSENEYELFGKGSTSTNTSSSTSTVVRNDGTVKRRLKVPPPPLPPRTSSIEWKHSLKSNRDSVVTVINVEDLREDESSSNASTLKNEGTQESDSDSHIEEGCEQFKMKTSITANRIPPLCTVTPPYSDDESRNANSTDVTPVNINGPVTPANGLHFVPIRVGAIPDLVPREDSLLSESGSYISLKELPPTTTSSYPFSASPVAIISPTNSLERKNDLRVGARVTLDSHGEVIYSSDSLPHWKKQTTSFEPGERVRIGYKRPDTLPLETSLEQVPIIRPNLGPMSPKSPRGGAYVNVQGTTQIPVPLIKAMSPMREMNNRQRSLSPVDHINNNNIKRNESYRMANVGYGHGHSVARNPSYKTANQNLHSNVKLVRNPNTSRRFYGAKVTVDPAVLSPRRVDGHPSDPGLAGSLRTRPSNAHLQPPDSYVRCQIPVRWFPCNNVDAPFLQHNSLPCHSKGFSPIQKPDAFIRSSATRHTLPARFSSSSPHDATEGLRMSPISSSSPLPPYQDESLTDVKSKPGFLHLFDTSSKNDSIRIDNSSPKNSPRPDGYACVRSKTSPRTSYIDASCRNGQMYFDDSSFRNNPTKYHGSPFRVTDPTCRYLNMDRTPPPPYQHPPSLKELVNPHYCYRHPSSPNNNSSPFLPMSTSSPLEKQSPVYGSVIKPTVPTGESYGKRKLYELDISSSPASTRSGSPLSLNSSFVSEDLLIPETQTKGKRRFSWAGLPYQMRRHPGTPIDDFKQLLLQHGPSSHARTSAVERLKRSQNHFSYRQEDLAGRRARERLSSIASRLGLKSGFHTPHKTDVISTTILEDQTEDEDLNTERFSSDSNSSHYNPTSPDRISLETAL
ncbi:unnamed protein product, partial [Darwinula stevensoni]